MEDEQRAWFGHGFALLHLRGAEHYAAVSLHSMSCGLKSFKLMYVSLDIFYIHALSSLLNIS